MVGRSPDRRHRCRSELHRRRSRRNTRSSCSSAATSIRRRWRRRTGSALRPAGRRTGGALPGHVADGVPAVPARSVCHEGRPGAGRRRAEDFAGRCKFLPAPTQHWVPFIAADGRVYNDGPAGCAGQPPESQSVGGSALPSNETFGVTGLDGRGTADFDIWTSAENASLGCTQLVACSLVAVPIMGISCDVSANGLPTADRPPASQAERGEVTCARPRARSNRARSSLRNSKMTSRSAEACGGARPTGETGSPCRSRSRFRATRATSSMPSNDVDVFGSELLIQATGQWAPHFCLNPKLFKFTHVQTGEPEARNLLATGSAEAAFISDPPPDGYGKPVVNAPVAVTGFAISYVDRWCERIAVHEAAAHAAVAGEAPDRVISGGVASAGRRHGAFAQPAQHHPRPGVREAQSRESRTVSTPPRRRRRCSRCRATPT